MTRASDTDGAGSSNSTFPFRKTPSIDRTMLKSLTNRRDSEVIIESPWVLYTNHKGDALTGYSVDSNLLPLIARSGPSLSAFVT